MGRSKFRRSSATKPEGGPEAGRGSLEPTAPPWVLVITVQGQSCNKQSVLMPDWLPPTPRRATAEMLALAVVLEGGGGKGAHGWEGGCQASALEGGKVGKWRGPRGWRGNTPPPHPRFIFRAVWRGLAQPCREGRPLLGRADRLSPRLSVIKKRAGGGCWTRKPAPPDMPVLGAMRTLQVAASLCQRLYELDF